MKKRKGSLLLEIAVTTMLVTIMLSFTLAPMGNPLHTVNDDMIKDQRMMIDTALQIWYSSHSGKYPDNLAVLQDMNFISPNIDLSLFTYSLRNNNTEYHLTATLSTGSSTSIESNF